MVGRRQLRESLLKVLYAYSKNEQKEEVVTNNMMQSIEKIYALYIFQLNLLLALKEEALEKIEISKNKNFKSEEDENPNLKFVNNWIFKKLEENQVLSDFTQKNQQLTWREDNQYPLTLLKKIQSSELFKKYMSTPTQNFEEDKTFIIKVFDQFISKNESLIDFYEEKDIAWSDDFHIANSMTYKTLKFLEEKKEFQSLLKIFKGEDDKIFIKNLLAHVMENENSLNSEIEKKLVNWELNRIADIDKIILQMALAELIYMPEIPPRVVINEYIELAKTFSTPSSNVFINGILDNFVKEKQIINN